MNYDQISILDILMIKKQLEKMPMRSPSFTVEVEGGQGEELDRALEELRGDFETITEEVEEQQLALKLLNEVLWTHTETSEITIEINSAQAILGYYKQIDSVRRKENKGSVCAKDLVDTGKVQVVRPNDEDFGPMLQEGIMDLEARLKTLRKRRTSQNSKTIVALPQPLVEILTKRGIVVEKSLAFVRSPRRTR